MVFVVIAVPDAIDTKHAVVFGDESLARFRMGVYNNVCCLWQKAVNYCTYKKEGDVKVHLESRLGAASHPASLGAPHQTW
jgi:hypothetical protein